MFPWSGKILNAPIITVGVLKVCERIVKRHAPVTRPHRQRIHTTFRRRPKSNARMSNLGGLGVIVPGTIKVISYYFDFLTRENTEATWPRMGAFAAAIREVFPIDVDASRFRPVTIRVQAAYQDRPAATQSIGNPYSVGERLEGCPKRT